jgi:epoxyqueuosine reductase
VFTPQIVPQAAEFEELIRKQGFSKVAFVRSKELPQAVARHPEIVNLGEGTFLLTALSCHREEPEDLSVRGDPHGLIAPFARRNYYAEGVARLQSIVRTLRKTYGLSKRSMRIFSNSRLPEKALAVASGLGSYGKNTLILIPGLGSLFVIAGLFIPVTMEGILPSPLVVATIPAHRSESAATEQFPLCGSCRSCQNACPVDALGEAGRLDENRCLQALCTQPTPLSEASRRAWAFRFYGCQSCQDICPHNRSLNPGPEIHRGELGPSVALKHLLGLSTEQIKRYLRGSTLSRSWIPPRTLLRNALIAAGNHQDSVVRDQVVHHCSNSDPLVARAAAWALGRIEDALPERRDD